MPDQLTPTQAIKAAEKAHPASETGFSGSRAVLQLMIARGELKRAKRAAKKASQRVSAWQEKVDLLAERARVWESRTQALRPVRR